MRTLSIAEASANLSRTVDSAMTSHERFEVTRSGSRVAVLLSTDDYDSLVETMAILSLPREVEAVRRGIADLDAGQVSSAAEVRAGLTARGRLNGLK